METILVVDDEQGMRELLTVLLEHQGYRVIIASDGEQALELIAHQSPDLVISDVRMPRMDGIGLLTGIRKTDPHLPVIMVTAYASMDSTIQAMRLGAHDYITKPFRIDEIRLVVEKALARSGDRMIGPLGRPRRRRHSPLGSLAAARRWSSCIN